MKNIIRYDIQHSENFVKLIKSFSLNLINLEFYYIECIITQKNISKNKLDFIKKLLELLFDLEKKIILFSSEVYFNKIKLSLEMAIQTTNTWKRVE